MDTFILNQKAENSNTYKEAKKAFAKKGLKGGYIYLKNLEDFGPIWRFCGEQNGVFPLFKDASMEELEKVMKQPKLGYIDILPQSIFYHQEKRYYLTAMHKVIRLKYLENYELAILSTEQEKGIDFDEDAQAYLVKAVPVQKSNLPSFPCWLTVVKKLLSFRPICEDEEFPFQDIHPNAMNWEYLEPGMPLLRYGTPLIVRADEYGGPFLDHLSLGKDIINLGPRN